MAPGKIFHGKESGMWLLWSLCLDYPTFYENAKIFAQDLKRFHSHPDAQARLLPTNGVLKMEHDGRRKARLIAPVEGRQRLSWGIHRCRQRNKGQTFHGTCCTLKLANMAHWYHYCFINVSLREYIYILLSEGHEKHGMCGRLLRTIYGPKQSSRECLLLLTSFLLGIWFKQSSADHFLQRSLLYPAYVAIWPRIRRLGLMELGRSLAFGTMISLAYTRAMHAGEIIMMYLSYYRCCNPLKVSYIYPA